MTGTLDCPIMYHMPRFAVKIGDYFEFDGQTAAEVVPVMQHRYKQGHDSEDDFLKCQAIAFCEWNGKNYCYSNRHKFAKSMMKNGLLECVD